MTDRLKTLPIVGAIDFDGVIHQYSKGWDDGTIYDPPVAGAKDALKFLRSQGVQIIIYSVRATSREVFGRVQPSQLLEMEAWLSRYQIPYDEVWTERGKPLAHFYLDDRAIVFDNWIHALSQIKIRTEE